MTISDLDQYLRKLSQLDPSSDAYERVFVWREVLTAVWLNGFETGRDTERRDAAVVASIQAAEKGRNDA